MICRVLQYFNAYLCCLTRVLTEAAVAILKETNRYFSFGLWSYPDLPHVLVT
jgi:hypothetical protein